MAFIVDWALNVKKKKNKLVLIQANNFSVFCVCQDETGGDES